MLYFRYNTPYEFCSGGFLLYFKDNTKLLIRSNFLKLDMGKGWIVVLIPLLLLGFSYAYDGQVGNSYNAGGHESAGFWNYTNGGARSSSKANTGTWSAFMPINANYQVCQYVYTPFALEVRESHFGTDADIKFGVNGVQQYIHVVGSGWDKYQYNWTDKYLYTNTLLNQYNEFCYKDDSVYTQSYIDDAELYFYETLVQISSGSIQEGQNVTIDVDLVNKYRYGANKSLAVDVLLGGTDCGWWQDGAYLGVDGLGRYAWVEVGDDAPASIQRTYYVPYQFLDNCTGDMDVWLKIRNGTNPSEILGVTNVPYGEVHTDMIAVQDSTWGVEFSEDLTPANYSVEPTDLVNITVDLSNTGGADKTFYVGMSIGGNGKDYCDTECYTDGYGEFYPVFIANGNTESVTREFQIPADWEDGDTYNVAVSGRDTFLGVVNSTIYDDVMEYSFAEVPENVSVTINDISYTPSSMYLGENFNVTVNFTNTGNETELFYIGMSAGGGDTGTWCDTDCLADYEEFGDWKNITLNIGESGVVTRTFTATDTFFDEDDVFGYRVNVRADNYAVIEQREDDSVMLILSGEASPCTAEILNVDIFKHGNAGHVISEAYINDLIDVYATVQNTQGESCDFAIGMSLGNWTSGIGWCNSPSYSEGGCYSDDDWSEKESLYADEFSYFCETVMDMDDGCEGSWTFANNLHGYATQQKKRVFQLRDGTPHFRSFINEPVDLIVKVYNTANGQVLDEVLIEDALTVQRQFCNATVTILSVQPDERYPDESFRVYMEINDSRPYVEDVWEDYYCNYTLGTSIGNSSIGWCNSPNYGCNSSASGCYTDLDWFNKGGNTDTCVGGEFAYTGMMHSGEQRIIDREFVIRDEKFGYYLDSCINVLAKVYNEDLDLIARDEMQDAVCLKSDEYNATVIAINPEPQNLSTDGTMDVYVSIENVGDRTGDFLVGVSIGGFIECGDSPKICNRDCYIDGVGDWAYVYDFVPDDTNTIMRTMKMPQWEDWMVVNGSYGIKACVWRDVEGIGLVQQHCMIQCDAFSVREYTTFETSGEALGTFATLMKNSLDVAFPTDTGKFAVGGGVTLIGGYLITQAVGFQFGIVGAIIIAIIMMILGWFPIWLGIGLIVVVALIGAWLIFKAIGGGG